LNEDLLKIPNQDLLQIVYQAKDQEYLHLEVEIKVEIPIKSLRKKKEELLNGKEEEKLAGEKL